MDVPLMILQPGIHGTTSLSNVNLATLTGDPVYTRCSKSLVIFDRLKETGYFLGRQANRFDVMPGTALC
jgi:hypothetical protein